MMPRKLLNVPVVLFQVELEKQKNKIEVNSGGAILPELPSPLMQTVRYGGTE